MCPKCSELFAYGRALVTRMVRLRLKLGAPQRGSAASVAAARAHYATAVAARSGVFDVLELRFVVGVEVSLFARDQAVVVELLQRAVHRAHAFAAARLHDVFELLDLALANQVGCGRRVDEDLECNATARPVFPLDELLRDDAAQRRR